MKKLWTGAFCALTAVLLAGTVSAAYDITASGDEWTLEGNGTLYITGTISLEAEGWEEYDSQIKKVVLTAGRRVRRMYGAGGIRRGGRLYVLYRG